MHHTVVLGDPDTVAVPDRSNLDLVAAIAERPVEIDLAKDGSGWVGRLRQRTGQEGWRFGRRGGVALSWCGVVDALVGTFVVVVDAEGVEEPLELVGGVGTGLFVPATPSRCGGSAQACRGFGDGRGWS